jgi:hypothetical protein
VAFKPKLVCGDKDYFILIKGIIQHEEITIINLYVPNVYATNFIKYTLMDIKSQIDPNIMKVGDFNTPILW